MKKPFPKSQQIFFLSLTVVLAVTSAVWVYLSRPEIDVPFVPAQSEQALGLLTENVRGQVLGSTPRNAVSIPVEPKIVEITEPEAQSFTLNVGDFSLALNQVKGGTLYDALTEARDNGKISLVTKNYPGLGFYVTDIGSLHEVSGKHLIYYVNGKEATVGVSLYVLKDGDTIEWKLE